jgi:AGZA family xanthine/uracil permease-like MFS transporter
MHKTTYSIKTEFLAGLTTFLTMSYIVIVNPAILATEGTGMPHSGIVTATVLVAFSMTLLMGLYAKLPFAVAPGMGLNAFFTYQVVLTQKVPWPIALGAVFWSGILFLLISATPLREIVAHAIPKSIRMAAAGGIGLFLTLIGLKSAGLVVASSATLVKIGHLGWPQIFCILGIFVIVAMMKHFQSLAFLTAIVFVTCLTLIKGDLQLPAAFFASPDFSSVFGQLDIMGALKISLLPTIISIMLTDMFDSISTFVGVSHAGGLLDEEGNPKNLRRGLLVDAIATFFSGIAGTSPGTAYIESAAGIKVGGRTGLTSIFTALFFVPCLFMAPIIGMVPTIATAPVLIVLGAMMFSSIQQIEQNKYEELIPAFLTLIMIPLTFSITQGLLWGMISHVVCYLISSRAKEISVATWVLSGICLGLLVIENYLL